MSGKVNRAPVAASAARPLIQITHRGTVVSAARVQLSRLRREFARNHCLVLRRLLEPGLLADIQQIIPRASFRTRRHGRIARELTMEQNQATDLLMFLANDLRLFRVIEYITACGRIGSFDGRVYRLLPCGEHFDTWHDDVVEHRLVTLSLNLSAEIYSGGVLQIRDERTRRIVHQVANIGSGDGLLFRIAPFLKHRVTRVTGHFAKTALAGWFRSDPMFHAEIRAKLTRLF